MKGKLLLYMTAFFSGMTIMAVELSASRLLAPYYGTSSIVWTLIIGIIMIALSIGNVLGGRSADKHNNLSRLFFYIWLASIWIAFIPILGKYIIGLSAIVMMWILPDSLVVSGTVFSCLVIFSVPLLILGMSPPYLVKLGIKDMENNGRITGEIYAIGTVGSIIGTFIPTFLTIPTIGTQKTFFLFALILNIICLTYYISKKLTKRRNLITAVIILALLIIPFKNSFAFWKDTLLEDESSYNYLQVYEDEDSVMLSTNVIIGVQSIYMKNNAITGMYYEYGLMAPFFIKDKDMSSSFDVLVLGNGTGTYAKRTKYFFPESSLEGVEIDKKIVDISKEYFELTDEEQTVYVYDGRTFLMSKHAKEYDIVLIDAYHDITIPFHMATVEFYREVKKHLKPGGVILLNICMKSKTNTELEEYLSHTLKSEMDIVYKYDIPRGSNMLVFGSNDMDCLDNYINNIKKIPEDHPLKNISKNVEGGLVEITKAEKIMTDDISPIEIVGHKLLDELISEDLEYYKGKIMASDIGILEIFNLLD
jgi:spermidine synthase